MEKLRAYFLKAHQVVITEKAAARLAETVRNMKAVEPWLLLSVTGSDAAALLPRRVDATVAELRDVLAGRRVA
jgi:hypothetical protein